MSDSSKSDADAKRDAAVRMMLHASSLVPVTTNPVIDALSTALLRATWLGEATRMASEHQAATSKGASTARQKTTTDTLAACSTLQESLSRTLSQSKYFTTEAIIELDRTIGLKVLESMEQSARATAEKYQTLEPPPMADVRAARIRALEHCSESLRQTSPAPRLSEARKAMQAILPLMQSATGSLGPCPADGDALMLYGVGSAPSVLSDALKGTIASLASDGPDTRRSALVTEKGELDKGSLFKAGCKLLELRRQEYETSLKDLQRRTGLSDEDKASLRGGMIDRLKGLGKISTALTWLGGDHEAALDASSFGDYIARRKEMRTDERALECVGSLIQELIEGHTEDGDGKNKSAGAGETRVTDESEFLQKCSTLQALLSSKLDGKAGGEDVNMEG